MHATPTGTAFESESGTPCWGLPGPGGCRACGGESGAEGEGGKTGTGPGEVPTAAAKRETGTRTGVPG